MVSSNIKGSISTKPTSNPMHLLLKLAPPQAIIHIGAGTGNGEMHQWRHWGIPHVLIIDADLNRLYWTEPLISENPGWRALGAILAETEGVIDYYQASNPEEDSLISPQRLNRLWPSLRATAQDLRPSRRLDHLLAEDCSAALKQADPIWVFVDCLPALPILKGAGTHIESWSILWLRVLLQPTAGIDECATLESTKAFLQPQGFRCIDVKESNHPAVGYALFMRDWRAVLQPRIETLTQANAVLTEEKMALTARRNTLEEKITMLTQAQNEQSQHAARHQTELAHMQNQLKQKDSRIAQLESDLAELNARQHLLNDEITRAEIQIDLIKDVLLREPGL